MLSYKRIWILDGSLSCQSTYKEILDERYITNYFVTPAEVKNCIQEKNNLPPDLIITDTPFLEFNESLNLLSNIPFIVISDSDREDLMRHCFSRGALDYLMKPLRKNEIKVKIEKYLSKYLIVHDQQNIKLLETIKKSLGNRLTVKAVAIIEAFFKSADLSATRKTIVDHVWINVIVNPKTLDVHLYNLRKKLNEIGVSISINSPGCWQLFLGDMTDSKASNQDFLPSNS